MGFFRLYERLKYLAVSDKASSISYWKVTDIDFISEGSQSAGMEGDGSPDLHFEVYPENQRLAVEALGLTARSIFS